MRVSRSKEEKGRRKIFPAIPALLAAVCLVIVSLAGCAVREEASDDGRMKVVTTIFPQYDFARAISGPEELASVRMLLSPGEEVHSYEPTPLDIKEIQNCDLFIYVGGENDVWVDRILENMGDNRPHTLRLVDLTDTVEEEIVEGMMQERGEHEHDEHDLAEGADGHGHEEHSEPAGHSEPEEPSEPEGHGEPVHGGDSSEEEHEEADEHVWTSPAKAAEITEGIAAEMARIDPANKEQYLANARAYEEELLEIDAQFRQIVRDAERRTLVFGDRFPFRYFAIEYGLNYYAAFPGCSSESEPSASTLAFLIDKVRSERIPVVFTIELSNGNIARAICESSGAAMRTFHSCHNVTKEQMESGATYVSLMRDSLVVVREALCESGPRGDDGNE